MVVSCWGGWGRLKKTGESRKDVGRPGGKEAHRLSTRVLRPSRDCPTRRRRSPSSALPPASSSASSSASSPAPDSSRHRPRLAPPSPLPWADRADRRRRT